MEPGDTVRWWTKSGGWAFGTVASIAGATVRVHEGKTGPVRRVNAAEIREWPPRPVAAEDDTTPPRVKRGK
jgi:hypothetical protein